MQCLLYLRAVIYTRIPFRNNTYKLRINVYAFRSIDRILYWYNDYIMRCTYVRTSFGDTLRRRADIISVYLQYTRQGRIQDFSTGGWEFKGAFK